MNRTQVDRTPKNKFVGGKPMKKPYQLPPLFVPRVVKCFECGDAHYKRDCPEVYEVMVEEKRCYVCNNLGYFVHVCPERKMVNVQQPSSSRLKLKATKPGNLMLDTCFLFERCVHVLFEFEAIHSFVSSARLEDFSLLMNDLGYELVVSTPTSR